MSHFIEVCPEGQVVRQCRCPGGTKTVVPCPPNHRHAPKEAADVDALVTELSMIAQKVRGRRGPLISQEDLERVERALLSVRAAVHAHVRPQSRVVVKMPPGVLPFRRPKDG